MRTVNCENKSVCREKYQTSGCGHVLNDEKKFFLITVK